MASTIRVFILMLFILPHCHVGIADNSKKALRSLNEGDFAKTQAILAKDLAKDSLNVATHYIYSLLYTRHTYARYHVDTAHAYIVTAFRLFSKEFEKRKAQLDKLNVDSVALQVQKTHIDSLAFGQARTKHTIAGYEYFMQLYAGAKQGPEAESLRDQLAFDEAAGKNTWKAYEYFFTSYPMARQVVEAKSRYDRLIFADMTKAKNLAAYLKFLRDFPDTPFRKLAEWAILEIMAVDNKPKSYLDFLRQFPDSQWSSFVMGVLYQIDKEFDNGQHFDQYFPNGQARDSLVQLRTLDGIPLLAIYNDGLYGFMDFSGKTVLPLKYTAIDPALLCGNITSDYLQVVANNTKILVNRLGEEFYKGNFTTVSDIGSGFLQINEDNQTIILHKSGVQVLSGNFQKIEMMANALLLVKSNGKYGVYSLLGKKLIDPLYDEIEQQGNFILVGMKKRLAVLSLRELYGLADKEQQSLTFKYEDAELAKGKYLHVSKGDYEAVLDEALNEIIPWAEQSIYPVPKGWIIRQKFGYRMIKNSGQPSELATVYDQLKSNEAWTATKQSNNWTLKANGTESSIINNLDSINLVGKKLAYFQDKGVRKLRFPNGTEVVMRGNSTISVIGASVAWERQHEYYLMKEPDRCVVYNESGKVLFAERIDHVDYLMPGYFETTHRGRKGIIDTLGRFALETRYQAVGKVSDKLAMIISDGKFGLINLPKKRLIGANYDERLQEYNDNFIIAVQGGRKGLISAENARKQINFEYQEIKFWKDSVALMKRNDQWALVNIYSGKTVGDEIKSFKYLKNENGETAILYLGAGGYGVMDNKRGTILKPVYNDIVNLGTPSQPIYFTEQHLPQAEFYVVTYTDALGKVIRSHAYRSSEYGKIYCEE